MLNKKCLFVVGVLSLVVSACAISQDVIEPVVITTETATPTVTVTPSASVTVTRTAFPTSDGFDGPVATLRAESTQYASTAYASTAHFQNTAQAQGTPQSTRQAEATAFEVLADYPTPTQRATRLADGLSEQGLINKGADIVAELLGAEPLQNIFPALMGAHPDWYGCALIGDPNADYRVPFVNETGDKGVYVSPAMYCAKLTKDGDLPPAVQLMKWEIEAILEYVTGGQMPALLREGMADIAWCESRCYVGSFPIDHPEWVGLWRFNKYSWPRHVANRVQTEYEGPIDLTNLYDVTIDSTMAAVISMDYLRGGGSVVSGTGFVENYDPFAQWRIDSYNEHGQIVSSEGCGAGMPRHIPLDSIKLNSEWLEVDDSYFMGGTEEPNE